MTLTVELTSLNSGGHTGSAKVMSNSDYVYGQGVIVNALHNENVWVLDDEYYIKEEIREGAPQVRWPRAAHLARRDRRHAAGPRARLLRFRCDSRRASRARPRGPARGELSRDGYHRDPALPGGGASSPSRLRDGGYGPLRLRVPGAKAPRGDRKSVV